MKSFLEPEREGFMAITSQDFAFKVQDSKPWLIQVYGWFLFLHLFLDAQGISDCFCRTDTGLPSLGYLACV